MTWSKGRAGWMKRTAPRRDEPKSPSSKAYCVSGTPYARLEMLSLALYDLTSRHTNPLPAAFPLRIRCAFGPPGNASCVWGAPHIQARQLPSSLRPLHQVRVGPPGRRGCRPLPGTPTPPPCPAVYPQVRVGPPGRHQPLTVQAHQRP